MNICLCLLFRLRFLLFFKMNLRAFFINYFRVLGYVFFITLTLASVGVQTYTTMRWIFEIMQARIHAMMLAFSNCFHMGIFCNFISKFIFVSCFRRACMDFFWWLKRKEAEKITFKVTCTYLFVWLSLY